VTLIGGKGKAGMEWMTTAARLDGFLAQEGKGLLRVAAALDL